MIFVLCFRDIMVGTRHKPEGGSANDEEICQIIHEEVDTTIREAIPDIFESINTTMIETFEERYVVVTEAATATAPTAVAPARP